MGFRAGWNFMDYSRLDENTKQELPQNDNPALRYISKYEIFNFDLKEVIICF